MNSESKLIALSRNHMSWIIPPWFFFVFYGPRLYGIDFGLLIAVFGLLAIVVKHGGKLVIIITHDNYIKLVISAFLYILFSGLFWFIFDIDENLSLDSRLYYAARLLRAISIWGCITFFYIRYESIEVVKAMFYVGIFHIVSVYISIYDLFGLRDFVVNLNTYNEWSDEGWEVFSGLRAKGLMTGYDQAGTIIIGWLLIGLTLYKKMIYRVMICLVGLGGMIFTSRTALYAIFIAGIIAAIIEFKKIGAATFYKNVLLILIPIFLLYQYFSEFMQYFMNNPTLAKSFEPLINLFMYDNLSTASTDDLLSNHFNFQGYDWFTIIFGNPQRSASGGSLDSDVGYIQLLYNFGIFFGLTLILYHIILITKYFFLRKFQKNFYSFIFIIATIILIIISLKGPYFFGRGYYDYWLLLLIMSKYPLNNINKYY